jgi:hypothetical protein
MAFYKSTFTNKYLANATSTIDGPETISVTKRATKTYENGLKIDAGGQPFLRNGDSIHFNCSDKKILDYTFSTNVTGVQLGAAMMNFQSHYFNLAAAATNKSEISGIYFLSLGFFCNPSPYKVAHIENETSQHAWEPKWYVLSWRKSKFVDRLHKKTVQFCGLTIEGW